MVPKKITTTSLRAHTSKDCVRGNKKNPLLAIHGGIKYVCLTECACFEESSSD